MMERENLIKLTAEIECWHEHDVISDTDYIHIRLPNSEMRRLFVATTKLCEKGTCDGDWVLQGKVACLYQKVK